MDHSAVSAVDRPSAEPRQLGPFIHRLLPQLMGMGNGEAVKDGQWVQKGLSGESAWGLLLCAYRNTR